MGVVRINRDKVFAASFGLHFSPNRGLDDAEDWEEQIETCISEELLQQLVTEQIRDKILREIGMARAKRLPRKMELQIKKMRKYFQATWIIFR